MSTPLMEIKLFQDHARVRNPGATLEKPIGIKDLITVLCDSAQNVFQYSRSERIRLPANTYLTEYAGNLLNLAMYFPEHPATVQHRSTKYEIMIPNIVIHMALKVSNNGGKHEVSKVFYYCTPESRDNLPNAIPGRLNKVFGHVPFPNFYDNHTMCYGGNSLLHMVEGGDLRIFKMYYDIIEGSPFNNDLSINGVRFDFGGEYKRWFQEMARVYKEEQRFPYEHLSL